MPTNRERQRHARQPGERIKPVHRDLNALSPRERSAELWLNADDVLSRIGISRSALWNAVAAGTFPKPYKVRGGSMWTQADVRLWIHQATQQVRVERPAHIKPVTWAAIEQLLKERAPQGLTNVQISHLLSADNFDTSALTRIMTTAGVLVCLKPVHCGPGGVNFYVYNDGTIYRDESPKSGEEH